jgi:hypothetical protein
MAFKEVYLTLFHFFCGDTVVTALFAFKVMPAFYVPAAQQSAFIILESPDSPCKVI